MCMMPGDVAVERNDEAEGSFEVVLDENGRAVIPAEIARRLGLVPGARLRAELDRDQLLLRRPTSSLAKVYVEPTSRCNLTCRTCMRNAWEEPLGSMSAETFARIIDGITAFDPVPTVSFGGFGEPLSHPRIVDMVARAKASGARVELITNGTLLRPKLSRELIEAGLDRLWVSLDGASAQSYLDVRLADVLPGILDNLARFHEIAQRIQGPRTELGIAFVAMRRNIADLPALLRLSSRVGATRYMITNLLPYTREHGDETLYQLSLSQEPGRNSSLSPQIELPWMDVNARTRDPLNHIFQNYANIRVGDQRLNRPANRCPFISRGATAVGWDGELSPCLALIHSYTSYLYDRVRTIRRYTLGNIRSHSLRELWESAEYVAFRQRVEEFDFSPCSMCGTCDLAEKNEEDCFGNTFPTCGGCLWAQGVIQCP